MAEPQRGLRVRPCDLREANRFVGRFHRHHKPVRGYRWAIAAEDAAEQVVGVAIAGRPVARAWGLRDYGIEPQVWGGDPAARPSAPTVVPPRGRPTSASSPRPSSTLSTSSRSSARFDASCARTACCG